MTRLVAVLLMAIVGESAHADDARLLFPDGDKSAGLRLEIADEQKTEAAWVAFLDKLFAYFDRDSDGTLSEAEAKRIFALPLPGGKELAPNFTGNVTPEEFRAFYRKHGFTPVTVAIQNAPQEVSALGDVLFHRLDRNGDGKLSASELRQATALLKRLDENEDEVLTAEELFGTLRPAKITPKTSLKLDSAEKASTTLKLARDGKSTLAGKGDLFKLEADNTRLRVPGGVCAIGFDSTSPTAAFNAAKDFYLAQFNAAAGDKPATKQLFEDDPTTQVLAGLFDVADRNGDGKLTRAELDAFFEVIELGVKCRAIVTIADRGRNLFDLFDANSDGRLDLDELTRAAKSLPDKLARDKPLESAAVPASYKLVVGSGPVGDSFGPVPFGAAAKPKPPAAIPARGPKWFLAMDKNRDGFLSPQEFIGSPKLFTKLDANNDGRISIEEAEAAK